jgi:hypothetical protein
MNDEGRPGGGLLEAERRRLGYWPIPAAASCCRRRALRKRPAAQRGLGRSTRPGIRAYWAQRLQRKQRLAGA